MREEIISFISDKNQPTPFFVEMAGISYCDETYRISRKNSTIYIFEYVLEGEGTIISDGNQFTAKKGEVYMLHRQSSHEYYSSKSNPWIKIWFNARGTLIDSLIRVYQLNQVNLIQGTNSSSLFFKLFSKAKQSKLTELDFHTEASLLFHEFILCLYKNVNAAPSSLSKEALVLKQFLDKNSTENITIDMLSRQIYRSPSQAIRIFKQEFGQTPYHYLMNQKLELARLLLLNTTKGIKEIALELNFCDEHYFSNYFKEKIGLSPLNYRKTEELPR